jgi:hypothetical protein
MSKGADGRRPSCLRCEPHADSGQAPVGWHSNAGGVRPVWPARENAR